MLQNYRISALLSEPLANEYLFAHKVNWGSFIGTVQSETILKVHSCSI